MCPFPRAFVPVLAAALIVTAPPELSCQVPPVWRLSETPQLAVGSRDGSGANAFGRVAGAVRLRSGAVMVADARAHEVRLFSAEGTLLRSAGRFGEGPGDFRTIMSVRLCDPDSAYVYDPALMRISVFGPDGAFARAIDVRRWSPEGAPPYDFWCNRTGALTFLHRSSAPPEGIGPRRPGVAVTLVNRQGPLVRLGVFPGSERYFEGTTDFPRPLGKQTAVVIGARSVYVATGDEFEVARFSLSGTPLAAVRRAHSPQAVTKKQIDTYIAQQVARRRQAVANEAEAGFRALQYPKIYPPYAAVLVDALNNLWIEHFPVPGSKTRLWSIFAEAGQPLASLEVDGRFQLLEAGADYVLGIWTDELEVDYVRLYTLLK